MKVTIAFLLVSLCIDVCLSQSKPSVTNQSLGTGGNTLVTTSIRPVTSSNGTSNSSMTSNTGTISTTSNTSISFTTSSISISSTTSNTSISSTTTSSSTISTTSKSSSFNYACMPTFLAFLSVVGLLLL